MFTGQTFFGILRISASVTIGIFAGLSYDWTWWSMAIPTYSFIEVSLLFFWVSANSKVQEEISEYRHEATKGHARYIDYSKISHRLIWCLGQFVSILITSAILSSVAKLICSLIEWI